jgi:uncharacterized membrane protein YraQ (UPF0718 family)
METGAISSWLAAIQARVAASRFVLASVAAWMVARCSCSAAVAAAMAAARAVSTSAWSAAPSMASRMRP